MSVRTYKIIDIVLFTTITIIFQYVAVWGVNIVNIPMYSISLLIPLSLIVMMRWGIWAFIPITAGSITYCLALKASLNNYYVYIIGDLCILLALFWFIKGKDKVRNNKYICICYVLTGYFSVEIGRAIVSAILKNNFLNVLVGFLGVDSLSVAIALVVILIARKQNGLFEDQLEYLKRINKEQEGKS